ncbi:hypothetical protein Goshw_013223, partial [Gossypium schwendimanii]|nr:hypothetical protein [Gossypium schwendimanii]
TFKENSNPNKSVTSGNAVSVDEGKGNSGAKSRSDEGVLVCIARTARVSLLDSMNFMIELISTQLSKEVGKDSSSFDGKQLEEAGVLEQ